MREALRDFVITTGAAVVAVLFAVTGAPAQQSPDGPVKKRMSLDVPMPAEAGADVQVTLTWDVDSDLDLAVVEPSGEYIHYGNPTSRTGGTLDIDSNADCNIDGKRVENIRWPPGEAPEGQYRVEVAQYSSCGTSMSNYTVRIVNGASVQTFRGTISGERTIIEVATFSRRVGDPSRPVEQTQAECLNDAGVPRSPANPAWDPVVGPCVKADEADVTSFEDLVEACRACWLLHGGGSSRMRVSSVTTVELQRTLECLRQGEIGLTVLAGVGFVITAIALSPPAATLTFGGFFVTMTVAQSLGLSPVQILARALGWILGTEFPVGAGAVAGFGDYSLKVQSTNPDVLAFDFAANGDLEFHFGRSEPTAFVWTLMEGDTPIGSLVLPYTPRAAPPVDTTAPTVMITSAASEPVSGPFPITVTFSEPVTGFELPDLVVGNGSASELQGTEASYTATVTPAGTGAVTVDIASGAAEDSAGNPSAAADQFSITADTTAPTVMITSAASEPVSGPFPITVTFSEPVTGFELPDLVVGNGSASELQGTEASYTATVTPAGTGAVTVDIASGAAEDSAGNPSAAADQFSITADTTAPTVMITSAASEPVSGPFPITVTFSEPVTGFELPDLVVGNGSASELQGTEASYTATVTPAGTGAVTVDIASGAAEDSAGNPSAAADQFSIAADTTAPTVMITSAASEPVSGPFPITVTFSAPVTGFELPDLVVGNGSASELQGTEASYTATVTPAGTGAVTVDIASGAAEDSAGNPSAAADQFSITADLTPVPVLPLVGAVALAALLLIGGIRRRGGVLRTERASFMRRAETGPSLR